jgi:hypothetical protein
MKRFAAALVVCLLPVSNAYADPLYYSFEGTVFALSEDAAGLLAAGGIVPSTPVSYLVLVDLDAAGTIRYNDGTVFTFDATDTTSMFTFVNSFADYVSGGLLEEVGGGFFNDIGHTASDVAEFSRSWNRIPVGDPTGQFGALTVGSNDHKIEISSHWTSDGVLVEDWVVGMQMQGSEWAYAPDGTRSSFYSMLTLTRIDSTPPPVANPVPEPATLTLFGLGGALGLIGRRRGAREFRPRWIRCA